MKNMHLIILLGLILMVGCQTAEVDPRPPLMNTNAFTSFVPFTNEVEDLDAVVDAIIQNMTNNVPTNNIPTNAVSTNAIFEISSNTGTVFRIRNQEDYDGFIQ